MKGINVLALVVTAALSTGCASSFSTVDVQSINPDYHESPDSFIGSYEFEISKGQTVFLNKYVSHDGELCIQYVDNVTGETSVVTNEYGFDSYSDTVTHKISSYCEKDFSLSNDEPKFVKLLGFETVQADEVNYVQIPILKDSQ
ncbi:hypothetical protein [Vibrio sp. R78045]|uniref:hypothetical protein n=1 Tax=Vibrio sp. R78045 TaxID=3093868 RepID=UPI0036F39060